MGEDTCERWHRDFYCGRAIITYNLRGTEYTSEVGRRWIVPENERMSPENQWLEDGFPIEMAWNGPFLWDMLVFWGCI